MLWNNLFCIASVIGGCCVTTSLGTLVFTKWCSSKPASSSPVASR
jgi:hypothetical protein